MASVSHEPPLAPLEHSRVLPYLRITEMWAGVSISVMWLAVLFDSVFGPDIVSSSADGSSTTLPSGVAVALFALLATMSVAKHGLGRAGA